MADDRDARVVDEQQVSTVVLETEASVVVKASAVPRTSVTVAKRAASPVWQQVRSYLWLLGVPMIITFFLSASWTLTLAVVQAMPNQFANWLMDAESFDDGAFWMLPTPEQHIEVAAIVLLSSFSTGYLGLMVLMLFPDRLIKAKSEPPSVSPGETSDKLMKPTSTSMATPAIKTWRDRLRYELMSSYGLLRQCYNPVLDLPKLLFQTTLVTYLHNGFPVVIISIYTSLLCINWMISSYRYKQWRPDPHYVLARLFYIYVVALNGIW